MKNQLVDESERSKSVRKVKTIQQQLIASYLVFDLCLACVDTAALLQQSC